MKAGQQIMDRACRTRPVRDEGSKRVHGGGRRRHVPCLFYSLQGLGSWLTFGCLCFGTFHILFVAVWKENRTVPAHSILTEIPTHRGGGQVQSYGTKHFSMAATGL